METQQHNDTQHNTQMANAFAKTARLYETVERVLRRSAERNEWLTFKDIVNNSEVQMLDVTQPQIRYVITMFRNGQYIHTDKYAHDREHRYTWNVNAPAFVLGKPHQKRVARAPSKPVVIKPENTNQGDMHEQMTSKFTNVAPELLPAKQQGKQETAANEVELVIGGTTVIISRDAGNKRVRIEIEG